MLIRIWTTGFDPTRRADLEQFARDISAPMFDELAGCLGHIYAANDDTWVTQTFWESRSAILAAEDSARYRDVVGQIVRAGFLTGEQTTDVYRLLAYHPPGR